MKLKLLWVDNRYNRNMNRHVKGTDRTYVEINDDSKELVELLDVLKTNFPNPEISKLFFVLVASSAALN